MSIHTNIHTEDNSMYINPFLAGVLVTIGAEIAILFFAAVIAAVRRVNRGN